MKRDDDFDQALTNEHISTSFNNAIKYAKENPRIKDSIMKRKVDPFYQT
jgi:hypothetical protein